MQTERSYDVIIIGGGINGIGLFRDLSLHGVRSLLIEKGDFMSQTSSRSSKMLHGGIRYLESCDFLLIQEALAEKNLWVKLAPKYCQEKSFTLPIYKHSRFPLWMTYIGLKLYDLLSNFKNTPSKISGKKKLITRYPELKQEGLKGAALYHDAMMDDKGLGLACLQDALQEQKGDALAQTAVESITKENNLYKIVTDKNEIFWARDLVFTTGPFTDQLLHKLKLFPWTDKLIPSKGTHLWLRKESFPLAGPMVLQTKDMRIIFAIPWEHAILVGTTEEVISDTEIFNIQAEQKEIDYILSNINEYFPNLKICPEDVLSHFAGVRPLVKDDSQIAGKTSRQHKVFQPERNIRILLGGKWTTFRVMVQDIAAPLVQKYNPPYDYNRSLKRLRNSSLTQ